MTAGVLRRRRVDEDAFTLIELMIVVVIVAVLAMTAIPIYQSSVANARTTEGIAAVGSIRSALRTYAALHDYTYPVLSGVDGTQLDEIGVRAHHLEGKFFGPADYTITSDATTYTITAVDPDTGLIYEIDQDGNETTGDGYYTSGH